MLSTMGIMLLIFFFLPKFPIFYGSILPDETPFIIYLIINFYHAFLALILILNILVPLTFQVCYGLLIVPFFVKELQLGRPNYKYKASSNLRSSTKNLRNVYRQIQITQDMVNNFCGKILIPTHYLVTLLFVWSSFMIIRHKNSLELVVLLLMVAWSVTGPSLYIFFLVWGGYLHLKGLKVLSSWKNHGNKVWGDGIESKLMNKFRRSCRPICMCWGKAYVLNRLMWLRFVQGLSKVLMRALLTLETN